MLLGVGKRQCVLEVAFDCFSRQKELTGKLEGGIAKLELENKGRTWSKNMSPDTYEADAEVTRTEKKFCSLLAKYQEGLKMTPRSRAHAVVDETHRENVENRHGDEGVRRSTGDERRHGGSHKLIKFTGGWTVVVTVFLTESCIGW